MRHSFGLTLGQVGLALAAVSVGVTVTLIPWGILTDRVDERAVMSIGLVGTSVALGCTAFAPGYDALLIGLVAAGMFGASTTGASGRAVMGWFAREERAFALGIRQMALPLGGALSALALPPLVEVGGLRAALLVLAVLTLAAAFATATWMREPPEVDVLTPHASPPPMRDPRIWRLGIGSGLLVAAQASLLGFVALFLHDARGLSPAVAGAALAGIQFGGAIARLIAGRASDLRGLRIQPIRSLALGNIALLLGTSLLVAAPAVVLYPVLVGAGVGTMAWNGLAFTAAAEISGHARAGTAMSVQNMVISACSAVAPAVFGGFVELTSWGAAFGVLAAAPLAGYVVLRPLVSDEARRAAARTFI
jgi:MFS family permease